MWYSTPITSNMVVENLRAFDKSRSLKRKRRHFDEISLLTAQEMIKMSAFAD